jgi:hypothetical protein
VAVDCYISAHGRLRFCHVRPRREIDGWTDARLVGVADQATHVISASAGAAHDEQRRAASAALGRRASAVSKPDDRQYQSEQAHGRRTKLGNALPSRRSWGNTPQSNQASHGEAKVLIHTQICNS